MAVVSLVDAQTQTQGGVDLRTLVIDLIRRVDERMERLENKLDAIADERREEARNLGDMTARVDSLEDWRLAVEENVKGNHRLAISALLGTTGTIVCGLLYALVRLVILNPQVVH